MGSFVLFSNNHLLVAEKLQIGRRNGSICSFSNPRYNKSASFQSLGFYSSCNNQHRVLYGTQIWSRINGIREDRDTQWEKREHLGLKKRFSGRLRPRLRLFSRIFKRVLVRAALNDLRIFLRKNVKRVVAIVSISVALGLCFMFLKLTATPSPTSVPYSDLVMSLQNGTVEKVLFQEGSRRIYYSSNSVGTDETEVPEKGNLVDIVARSDVSKNKGLKGLNALKILIMERASTPQWQYSTRKIDNDESFLLSLMREKGIRYSSAPPSAFTAIRSVLVTVICLWIPLTPLMWLLYRQFSTANNPAKKRRPGDQIVGFDDVEGIDTAKVELMETVSCLQGSINYSKLGARLPRGVLLVGPPGTGKTLLARAVAGEAGVPFFTVSASEFVEMFVGRGAARIRDLFSVARKNSPSIIFIDELDAVGGKRGRSFNDERDQTLNQLLTEMDGFDSDMKVVVIAATNRPEALDPALCRPGRFSRKVFVGEPDEYGRRKILAVHLRGVPLEENPSLICSLVASLTPGFVGADLANIVNEAALLAARRGGEFVTREDIMDAIERAKFGINDREARPGTLTKELGKLFPWMPSLTGKNEPRPDGLQGPLGYQTIS